MTSGIPTAREDVVAYSHTQIGWWGLAIMGFVALWILAIFGLVPEARTRPEAGRIVAGLVTVVLVVAMVLFSTLTVRVTRDSLVWRFGPGLLSRRIPLAEIASATPTRLPLWAGLGIHWIGRGWVYNVSGRDAVEVVRVDGKVTFIGTDDAEGLAAAIEPRRASVR
ncbi:MAG TPA: hypothetical protein VF761_09735 [Gemmatimonadaceae bacterium]